MSELSITHHQSQEPENALPSQGQLALAVRAQLLAISSFKKGQEKTEEDWAEVDRMSAELATLRDQLDEARTRGRDDEETMSMPVGSLNLSERPAEVLARAQINTIGQLVEKSGDDLLSMTNMGQKAAEEIVLQLDLAEVSHSIEVL